MITPTIDLGTRILTFETETFSPFAVGGPTGTRVRRLHPHGAWCCWRFWDSGSLAGECAGSVTLRNGPARSPHSARSAHAAASLVGPVVLGRHSADFARDGP